MDGQSGSGYEYGRLEIFRRGFWGNICPSFTPDAAVVACRILGYDGGAHLQFRGTLTSRFENEVTLLRTILVSLALHCFFQLSSAGLADVLLTGYCWAYSAFSLQHFRVPPLKSPTPACPHPRMKELQVLAASLPIGISRVNCNGSETSLLQCSFSNASNHCRIPRTNFSDGTVLACGTTGPGEIFAGNIVATCSQVAICKYLHNRTPKMRP